MLRQIAIVSFVATLFIATPAMAQDVSTPQYEKPGTISLQGLGEIASAPDMAIVSSGVVTNAVTAREALDANTAAMNELFALLRAANVDERDFQTSNFSVQPQYVYPDRRDSDGYPKPPRLVGYQVSNMLTVRVRDLDNLGQLLDSSVSVGSNQINSVSFAVSKPAPLFDEARRGAMADAIAKAQLYAQAAGVTLGRIIHISEAGAIRPQFEATMARMAVQDAAVPVAAGELTFSKQVSVEWELVQE